MRRLPSLSPQASMDASLFAVLLLLGAAALAVWVDARFPSLAPADVRRVLLHVGGAMLALSLLPADADSVGAAFTLIFAGALPALVYACLAALWTVRFAQRALDGQFP